MDIQKVEEEKSEGIPEEGLGDLEEKSNTHPADRSTTMAEVFEEAEKDNEHPFMILLPEEVREEIYNKLPQSDMLPLRLVCQQWRDEIDRSFDYSLEFGTRVWWKRDIEQEEWNQRAERILQFRVKDLTLNANLTDEYPVLVLKYPQILRTLEINFKMVPSNDSNRDRFPLELYDQLLKSCTKSLVKLSMSNIPLIKLANDHPSYDLQNLKTLKLNSSGSGVYFGVDKRGSNQEVFFNNFIVSRLESLHIQVYSPLYKPVRRLSYLFGNGIVNLIGSSWRTLERLDLFLLEGIEPAAVGHDTDSEIPKENWNLFQKVHSLKKVRLIVNWSQLVSRLLKLLENQGGLEDVDIIMPLYRPAVIRSNYRSLVSIKIQTQRTYTFKVIVNQANQGIGPGGLYDLSDFQNCQNLKQLVLWNSELIGMMGDPGDPSHRKLVNFHLLPKSLVRLEIYQFLVSSNEIAAFFTDGNSCTNLETLLLQCGKSADGDGEFGVHYDSLAAILSGPEPNLTKLVIMEFNIKTQVEQDRIVSRLAGSGLRGLDMGNRNISISFKRNSYEDPWSV